MMTTSNNSDSMHQIGNSIGAKSKKKDSLPCKKRKRSIKSVQLSSSVSLRCFFNGSLDTPQSSETSLHQNTASPTASSSALLWFPKEEIESIQERARKLSKLHYHVRSKLSAQAIAKLGNATRYKIKGDSLRGMEMITDYDNGRKRRRVQDEAIRSIMVGQQEQLIQHVLDNCACTTSAISSGSSEEEVVTQVKKNATRLDTSKLANVYGLKAKKALAYAKQVGHEDAKVAAKILAEDLPAVDESSSNMHSSSTSFPCCISSLQKTSSSLVIKGIGHSNTDPRISAGFIKALLPATTLSRQLSVASKQA